MGKRRTIRLTGAEYRQRLNLIQMGYGINLSEWCRAANVSNRYLYLCWQDGRSPGAIVTRRLLAVVGMPWEVFSGDVPRIIHWMKAHETQGEE